MTNKFLTLALGVLIATTLSGKLAWADEEQELDKEAAKIEKVEAKDDVWNEQLKSKYSLTDEQIQSLRGSGLSAPQLAMVAQLAKSSNKSIDEVLKMRTEQKMGWGKIAKELGISPKELGHSVRDLRHSIRDERKMARAERKEKAASRREERKEKHAKK